MAITQLVLDMLGGNPFYLPESIKNYRAWEEDGGAEIEMISRRIVRELRGNIWRISYQYGWFNDEDKNRLVDICIRGRKQPIRCLFLPPNGDGLLSSDFFITAFNSPRFMWSRTTVSTENGELVEKPVPIWADFSFELREVRPHD